MSTPLAIVEDDRRFRHALERMIACFSDCPLVGSFATAASALSELPGRGARVVLMDIQLPDFSGIECVARLKPVMPHSEFIMLTAYEDTDSIFQALAAGASGYLLKQSRAEEIHAAVRQVSEGGAPMSSHIARKVVQAFRKEPKASKGTMVELTSRESEILSLLAEGLLYKEIASRLAISYATVNNHIRHIYEKLQVNSRSQAVSLYFQNRGEDGGSPPIAGGSSKSRG